MSPWPGVDAAWQLRYEGHREQLLYLDPSGAVDRMRDWADKALEAAVHSDVSRPLPLLISGIVKTGKSYTLDHVVPAVMADSLRRWSRRGRMQDMVIFRVQAQLFMVQGRATRLMPCFLSTLLTWARRERVPVRGSALWAAEEVLKRAFDFDDPETVGTAIMHFLEAVEVPVLVLVDEVQYLFPPTTGGPEDSVEAEYVRNVFMRQLLLDGPRTWLWCLTGAYMAHTWANIANMRPYGSALITSIPDVPLPATHSHAHLSLVWERLQEHFSTYTAGEHDPLLRQLCPPSAGLLTGMAISCAGSGRQTDVVGFVRDYTMHKLLAGSLREWKLALARMSPPQRRAVMDLTSVCAGARVDTDLHVGLLRFLEPNLETTADGRSYLKDPYYRQAVRMLFNQDGTMRKYWTDRELTGASMTQLDGGWTMLRLSEAADYLLGARRSHGRQGKELPNGVIQFRAKLQAIANELGSKMAEAAAAGGDAPRSPQELWQQQPWFLAVLGSPWNSGDHVWYGSNRQALGTHLAMLVFHLRLSRNVLAHQAPWDPASDVSADVSVIEALSGALGQPLLDFIGAAVGALRELPRCITDAASVAHGAAAPLPSGGDGGDAWVRVA